MSSEQLPLFGTVSIPLHNRRKEIVAQAMIDAADATDVLCYRWAYLRAGKGYAYRTIGSSSHGTRQVILMHREIMGLPRYKDGLEVDHRNRNGLDNRRENMRVLTHAQNRQNTSSHRGSTSIYRGVHWDTGNQRWRARVGYQGRKISVGSFLSQEEAHQAVRHMRRQIMPYTIEGT